MALCNVLRILILSFTLFSLPPFVSIEGKNRIVLRTIDDLKHLAIVENTTYIIRDCIDLGGDTFNVPIRSELYFKRKGVLKNGTLKGDNTRLNGKVKLDCILEGSFLNKEILVSWLNYNDRDKLSNQVTSVFNLAKPCVLLVDTEISMDGSVREVAYVAMEGNKKIRNSCRYRSHGDIYLKGVSFVDFEDYRELFLDLISITEPVNIEIDNILFDGCWNVSRFAYCPYKEFDSQSKIDITYSSFSRIKNYVIQFRPACTGMINYNLFENIGTDEMSNVIGLHLGDSDEHENRLSAESFSILNNKFKDFKVPFSDEHHAREAHAVLLYGHNNVIKGNYVSNFYSPQTGCSETGYDSEGIYLKGGNNLIEDNTLLDCIGSSPDGAITIKSDYENNTIRRNTIVHKYGIGIQCYTPNSRIEENSISSSYMAEAAIALLANHSTTIDKNNMSLKNDSSFYHAAIELIRSNDIFVTGNEFKETSGLLCTYSCDGVIFFNNNRITLSDKVYGGNTYYTAPVALHNDYASFYFDGNNIKLKSINSSQFIEAPDVFNGKLVFNNNVITVDDELDDKRFISYLVRNVDDIKIEGNTISDPKNKIKVLSNRHNISKP